MFDQTQNPYGFSGGYNYTGVAPQKVENYLTPEEIKELQQTSSVFSLGLTSREALQAKCNHRSIDGMTDTLVEDPATGMVHCSICGYEFRPVDPSRSIESIREDCANINDILQTIKIMYSDLPKAAAAEYFQIIPLIEKIPQLFEFAAKNFNKHELNNWAYNNANMGGIQMANQLFNSFGATVGGFGMPQQPVQPMMQPQFMNAPAPGMPGANPFGFNAAPAPMPYAPQQGAAPFALGQPAAPQPVAPTAQTPVEAAPAETTVTEKVTV